MANLRILLLTSSTGGGHDARAYSFQQWVERYCGNAVEVKVEKLLESASSLTRFGVSLYNWIQKFAPFLHNIYWCFIEVFGYLNFKFHFFGYTYYKNLIQSFKPQVIFSVHDSLNRGYFRAAKQALDAEKVRCVTYCGEFSGGFGYSRNWVDDAVDLFFSRTEEAQQYAFKLGLPQEKGKVFSNLFPPEVFSEAMTEEERKRCRRHTLGLDEEKFTVFLATGGIGANNHKKLLEILLKYTDKVQAIAICGKNRTAFNRLSVWKQAHPQFSLCLEAYSRQVHRLIQVSHAVVTRGGTNTAAEALFYGCPLIFHSFGGVMPQERPTINFFLHHGAAVRIRSQNDFAEIIADWKNFSDDYIRHKKHLELLRSDDDPSSMVNDVIAFAQEAAGAV